MNEVTLFLAGDVMVGRGVDQILPHPSQPELREAYVKDARRYVELAEHTHGALRFPVDPSYVWGEGLAVLRHLKPRLSVVNLETSITTSDRFWPGKAVHYRMHPGNVGCLTAAGIDVCTVANNHVLDFGEPGLMETLEVLRGAGIQTAGAGRNLREAWRPARLQVDGRTELLVFAFGSESSGIPRDWAAGTFRPGLCLLDELSTAAADDVIDHVRSQKRPGDIVLVSLHWGSNWGYEIPPHHVAFAHKLVDGGVDIVHGHSSHHVRPIEVYKGKLILYGCGDLVTDYEGIRDDDAWRGDLGAMYFATVSSRDGSLADLRLVPTHMHGLRLARAHRGDQQWLKDTLNRISGSFGARFVREEQGLRLSR